MLELYIEFNQAKFKSEIDKELFTTAYLKNAAFNWVDFKLHEFLNKTSAEWNRDRELIFSDFSKFKKELTKTFRVVDKKQAAKRHIHILKQNESAVKYSAEF